MFFGKWHYRDGWKKKRCNCTCDKARVTKHLKHHSCEPFFIMHNAMLVCRKTVGCICTTSSPALHGRRVQPVLQPQGQSHEPFSIQYTIIQSLSLWVSWKEWLCSSSLSLSITVQYCHNFHQVGGLGGHQNPHQPPHRPPKPAGLRNQGRQIPTAIEPQANCIGRKAWFVEC